MLRNQFDGSPFDRAARRGEAVFAIGANQEAAFFSGIRVKRTTFILYVLSGAISALALVRREDFVAHGAPARHGAG